MSTRQTGAQKINGQPGGKARADECIVGRDIFLLRVSVGEARCGAIDAREHREHFANALQKIFDRRFQA